MTKRNKFLVYGFLLSGLLLLGPGCGDPSENPDLGPSNNQQIFGDWRLSEIIRSVCDDADNNLRRPCNPCHTLTMSTEGTFVITNDDDEQLSQGVFTVRNDTDITFDPGIFTTEGVSSVRYDLIKGAMKFSYQDQNTLCSVIESYILVNNTVGG